MKRKKSIIMSRLPEPIKDKLNYIADKLWSNHAALMVGAGFSKNANEKFADWDGLSDKMYQDIYGKNPAKESDARYLSTLKLAYEYKLSKGEDVLNDLLKREIPDTDFEPSELHKNILELPWVDVFTTNYDTLLERAAEDIYKIRYETVKKTDELINSTKPRIIKLHGSFPDTTPFIITEDDYRTYPKKFAPFVNTVQQSLLKIL
ncbi:MAG: SIR2 family protein [Bacteroidales bacterium]|nr:SIR2 family protein [Bacteroidales bacterium]